MKNKKRFARNYQTIPFRNWSTHLEFLVIFLTLLGGIYSNLANSQQISARIDASNARTDQLYEMFCSLQSQTKDELIEIKKEFYMSIKEKHFGE